MFPLLELALTVLLVLAASPVMALQADHVSSGARALDRRDYRTAIAEFQIALKADPNNPQIMSSLGYSFAGAGRFADAARQFLAAAQLEPQVAAHHFNLGLSQLNAENYVDAEKAFRKTLILAPDHPRAKLQLANALLGQAKRGDNAKMRAAADAYRKALPSNPSDAELHFNYAFTLARTGDEEGALREYREVVRLAPRVPQAHFYLGITQFQLGDWEQAAANLTAAANKGLNDFWVNYYLGSALLRLTDREGARRYLEQAALLDPSHPGVHFQLASLRRLEGDKAAAAAEQQLFRDLTAKQELKWRSETLEKAAGQAIQHGDLNQAVQSLEQALESRPTASAARNLALAYLQRNEVEKARHALDRALELDPRDAAAYNYRGLLAARTNDSQQSIRYFEKAAELDPQLVDALYNAGVAAYEGKQYDLAAKRFRAALVKDNNPRIREALAMVLAESGRLDESRREFEAAQRRRAGDGTNR